MDPASFRNMNFIIFTCICYIFVSSTIFLYLCIHSVRVLFTFDSKFYDDFDGLDGKSGNDYMNEVMALVRNAYRDKSLKNAIGARINIIGTKTRYSGPTITGTNEQKL